MKPLRLFYRPTCPYCHKVIDFMEGKEIKLSMINVSENEQHRHDLVTLGGKLQVPCLDINGQALYESNDIIKWLEKENNVTLRESFA